MSYILDVNVLQPGDIVISSGSSLGAQVIKVGTWSKDTHAMLYVGHTLIHAIPDGGVFSKNPQREIFKKIDHVKVLRLKNSLPPLALNSICDYARSLTGSIYSVKEALLTKLHSDKQTDARTNMQFCSRLVAQSYASQGCLLVTNPHYCSPVDLSQSPLLMEITGAVRKASDAEINFSKTSDPNLDNQKVTYCWLNKVRVVANELGSEIQCINDVSEFIDSHPEQDLIVSGFIQESGYLEHYKCDLTLNPYRYDLDRFIEHFSSNEIPLAVAVAVEFKKEPGMIAHYGHNFIGYSQMYEKTNFKYHELHKELYLNMLNLIRVRLVVMYEALTPPTDINLKANVYILIQQIDNMLKPHVAP
ncbi:hypothetical protein [Aeromonas veronii]|uniref:hypothetical protein n=1 Tax=Aeromonas veronii TaxID=654 RepID=UPI003F746243